MAKYIDLITDNTTKHSDSQAATAKVVSDQTQLTVDQAAEDAAQKAADDSDNQLTVAVALQPQGVIDPSTGIVYQVISGVLHKTKPSDASSLDVPTASS